MVRMRLSTAFLVAFLASAVFAILHSGGLHAAPSAKATTQPGIVVLFRGGANIFSTGMDELADKLRDKGVNATSVGHATWKQGAADARADYAKRKQPIVFVGHSFGANAAVLAAQELGKSNIPVSLVVLYDPTTVLKAPSNVRHLVNYYSRTVNGLGLEVQPGMHFSGLLENLGQADVGHLEIDNDVRLQDQTIAQILRALGRRASASRD